MLYAARKVPPVERKNLERLLEYYDYSCGCVLQDLATDDERTPIINALVQKVYVRANLSCLDPIEIPYYSAECFEPVCYNCGSHDELPIGEAALDHYPSCTSCNRAGKERLKRKRRMCKDDKSAKKKK